MPDLYSAGRSLASAFGGDDYETAKQAEELRSIKRAAEMATTDKKVDQAIQESTKRQAVQSFFNNPDIPDKIKQLTLGGLGVQYEHAAKAGYRDDAVAAALAGNFEGANANLFGVANKPVEMVKVQGGQVIRNPWSADADVSPTNVAEAQAANSYASAGQHAASAALTNAKMSDPARFRAPAGGGARGGKPGAWTSPAANEINAYFGNENAKFTQSDGVVRAWTPPERAQRYERIKDFEAWRAANPNIRGGSEALLQYKIAKRGGGRGAAISATFAGDPTNVGDRKEQAYAAAGTRANGAGTQVPTPDGAITPKVPGVPETKGVTTIEPAKQQAAAQAIIDARAAIATGKITRAEAIRRLQAAGFHASAARL